MQVHWGKLLGWVFILIGGALACLWLLNGGNSAAGESQSHIGRSMGHLFAGRFDIILALIVRKLSMNMHLIGVSVWAKALLSSLLVMVVLVMKPSGLFRRWQKSCPYMMYGFSANAAGAVIALLVNDSGIVAAATMMIFVTVPMLLIRLNELNTDNHSAIVSHCAKY